jgi:hypothetical protein
MSKTSDIINLIRDVVNPIGLKVWKFSHPIDQEGVERIVLNSIPNNQVRAGSFKQNNDVVNVNIFVPKINGSPNSARIETLDNSVQNALESFNGITTRVGYYYLDPQPSQTFNESDKETITNIRIEVTYT